VLTFELDDRELNYSEFLVAKLNNNIVGFGRIRNYESSCELCSLGVIKPNRLQGIGNAIVKELILRATKPLYLVCIIPDFFKPHGFTIAINYPMELENKLNYCASHLFVPERYVVMKHF
jgi:N-acetylglutamate synthase-like GNAT family acetyltransferase